MHVMLLCNNEIVKFKTELKHISNVQFCTLFCKILMPSQTLSISVSLPAAHYPDYQSNNGWVVLLLI